MRFSKISIFLALLFVVGVAVSMLLSGGFNVIHDISNIYTKVVDADIVELPIPAPLLRHLKTPNSLRSIYMTSWTAGSPMLRNKLIKLVEETELNSVVIDVKDSTGAVSFKMNDPLVRKINPFENRISDIAAVIKELHDKNIYVIARIAVFEDPHLVKVRPDLAIKKASDGGIWKDRKGLSWSDIGSKEVWDYNIAVAGEAYKVGFDELNFDYIRFPSDGNVDDIICLSFMGKKIDKAAELRVFFHYLNKNLKDATAKNGNEGAPMSADMFGMTTTNTDDLNIGQVLENAIPFFDYIYPMVYPSHYSNNFNGYKNPAVVPYDLVKFVLGEGVKRMIVASTSPNRIRPWLQDFDLGANYTAKMVRAEIQATYDAGLSSWLLWNPASKYTAGALEK